jgi:uncharacterized protein YdaU (DUF1376 family)
MMLWTDAYLADTTHLRTVEHGAYLLLLMAMWRAGGSLPNDDKRLAQMCRMRPDKWRAIAPTIRQFMTVEGDRITQKRLREEFELGTKKRLIAIQNGGRGGRAKALNKLNRELARLAFRATLSQPEPSEEGSSLRSEPKNTPLRGASSGRARPDPQLPLLAVVRTTPSKAILRAESDEVILDRALDQWNPWAASHGSPQVRALTGQRAIHCRQRMKDLAEMEGIDPDEAFRRLLAKCAESFFVKGQPRKKLSFDQLMREGFMVRMMEGEYLYEPKKGNGRW